MKPLSPIEKVERLFGMLTERYGALQMKQGQNIVTVKKSWANSVGRYALPDITTAMNIYFGEAKYTSWPTEGEMMEQLKAIGAKAESGAYVPREAGPKHPAVVFHEGLFRKMPPAPYVGFSYTQALMEVLQPRIEANRKKTFGEVLVEAWEDGDLNFFEQDAHQMFERWAKHRREFVRVRTVEDDAIEARREKFRAVFEECGYRMPK